MSCKHLASDYNVAWPTAELAVMGAEGAVNIIHRREIAAADDAEKENVRQNLIDEYKAKFGDPYVAARNGWLDDVIEPSESRLRLIRALNVLASKREWTPRRSTETSRCELSLRTPGHKGKNGEDNRAACKQERTCASSGLVVNRCIRGSFDLDRQDIHTPSSEPVCSSSTRKVMPIRAEDGRFQTLSQVTDHSGTPRSSSNAGPHDGVPASSMAKPSPSDMLPWKVVLVKSSRSSTVHRTSIWLPEEDAPSRAECCLHPRPVR